MDPKGQILSLWKSIGHSLTAAKFLANFRQKSQMKYFSHISQTLTLS